MIYITTKVPPTIRLTRSEYTLQSHPHTMYRFYEQEVIHRRRTIPHAHKLSSLTSAPTLDL